MTATPKKPAQAPPGSILQEVLASTSAATMPGLAPASPPSVPSPFTAETVSPPALDLSLSPTLAAHRLGLSPLAAELLRLVHKLDERRDECTLARAADALRAFGVELRLTLRF